MPTSMNGAASLTCSSDAIASLALGTSAYHRRTTVKKQVRKNAKYATYDHAILPLYL
jgi:hypothetical protein